MPFAGPSLGATEFLAGYPTCPHLARIPPGHALPPPMPLRLASDDRGLYPVLAQPAGRLVSTIVGAGVKVGPVRVPLPLTGRVGYLEFTYQDSDIRVTRGNR